MKKCVHQFIKSAGLGIILPLTFAGSALAQDIHFSQFYMSELTLNPAAAGAFKDITATTNYRNQWSSVNSPYKTFAAAVDIRAFQKKWKSAYLGFGLNVYNDVAGDGNLSTTIVDLSLAGHVKLDEHQILSAGLQGGFGQFSVTPGNLVFDSQYDPATGNINPNSGEKFANTSVLYPDLGAGILYQYNKGEMYVSGNDNLQSNIGFSVSHLTQPNLSFYGAPIGNDILYMKYVAHGNMTFGLKNTPLSLMPGFVYYRQGPAQEITAGSLVKYTLKEDSRYTGYVKGAAIALGAYYRWDDAVIISSLLEMSNYAIGFSYDVNVSGLRNASNGLGGFEIALRYINPSNFLYQNKARF